MKTHPIHTLAWSLALLLALYSCDSGQSTPDAAPQVPAAPGQQTAKPDDGSPAPGPDPMLPPPLAEPVEQEATLDQFLNIVENAAPSTTKANEDGGTDEDQAYMYQWTDDSGTLHVVDNESLVPIPMRSRMQKIPVADPKKTGAGGSAPSAPWAADDSTYDANVPPLPGLSGSGPPQEGASDEPGGLMEQMQNKRAEYQSWTDRLAALRADLAETRASLAEAEGQPPDCGLALDPRLTGNYDPNCESRWRSYIKSLKDKIAKQEKAIEDLKDAARRAGVPPGYVR